jgi:hypothetical protein
MATLLLALLLAQDAKARYADACVRMNKHVWEEKLDLADWCKSNGLPGEAAAHYRFVKTHIPGTHPYKTRAEKALAGSWKEKADSAETKTRETYAKKCAEYVRKAGDLSFECYKIAKAGKLNDLAVTSLLKTIEFDADHPGARKERGEVKDDAFGWVPEKSPWKAAATSKHFAIHTDRTDGDAAAARLEKMHDTFYGLVGTRFAPLTKPVGVVWLDDKIAFDEVCRGVPGAPPQPTAFYSHITNLVYATGPIALLEHEVIHAMADIGAEPARSLLLMGGKRADAPRDYWVIEGLACAVMSLGLGQAAPELPKGTDVAAFTKMAFTDFEKEPMKNYAIAHALTRSLLDGEKKEKFLDFIRDFYAGRGDFEKIAGK